MAKVPKPKSSLLFYYGLALFILAVFNWLGKPYFDEGKVKTVDYSAFLEMTEQKSIERIEMDENRIIFKGTDGHKYQTGPMTDPRLVERLKDSGIPFTAEIRETPSSS